jgi:hypothetical protein
MRPMQRGAQREPNGVTAGPEATWLPGEADESPRFVSKSDWWLGGLLWIITLVSAGAGIGQLWSSAPPLERYGCLAACLAVAALLLWLMTGTWYRVTREHLQIRCGPIRGKVPLRDIRSITPSRSLLSGPALSLDRMLVKYRGSALGVLISPKDKSGLLDAVAERAPHLQRHGDRLVEAERDAVS